MKNTPATAEVEVKSEETVVATPKQARPVLDKYAEAKRQIKISKRLRHRVTLRRSHTSG